jgi:hypothetical protein
MHGASIHIFLWFPRLLFLPNLNLFFKIKNKYIKRVEKRNKLYNFKVISKDKVRRVRHIKAVINRKRLEE